MTLCSVVMVLCASLYTCGVRGGEEEWSEEEVMGTGALRRRRWTMGEEEGSVANQSHWKKEIDILSYPGEISHVFQAAEVAREIARRGADVTFGVWEHDMDALLSTIEEAESRDEGPRKETRLRVCIDYESNTCILNKIMNGTRPFEEATDAGTIRIVPFALYKNSARTSEDGEDENDTRFRSSREGLGRDVLPRNLVQWNEAGAKLGIKGGGDEERFGKEDKNKYRMSREDKIALSKTVWNSGNDDDEVNRYAKDQLLMCPQLLRNERIAEVFKRADMLVLDGYFICNVLASFLHNRRYVAIRSFSAWPKGGCCEPWPQPFVGGIGSAKVSINIHTHARTHAGVYTKLRRT